MYFPKYLAGGFEWQATVKKTKIKLDPLADIEMLLVV